MESPKNDVIRFLDLSGEVQRSLIQRLPQAMAELGVEVSLSAVEEAIYAINPKMPDGKLNGEGLNAVLQRVGQSMTKEQKQAQFVSMRIEGKTFKEIAERLEVSRSTLFYWQRDSQIKCQINAGRAVALDETIKRCELSRQDQIKLLAESHQRILKEISTRDLSDVPTDKLFKILFDVQVRLEAVSKPLTIEPSGIDSFYQELNSHEYDPLDD